MSAEIQRADARLRVRFLILMTIVALLGAVGILQLNAYLVELHALAGRAQPLAAEKALRAVHTVLGLLTAGAALLSLHLGWFSWRTLSSGRFPPPGARVISDTRIHRGLQARRRGQAGLAIATLTILLTTVVIRQTERLFQDFFGSIAGSLSVTLQLLPVAGGGGRNAATNSNQDQDQRFNGSFHDSSPDVAA